MISMIVAYANGRVIGQGGKIPWHLPSDMRHFKRVTDGQTVVMGRKTFDSIGKPLPRRRNIVLTHDAALHLPGVEIIHDPQEVFALGDVFIIGGEAIYKYFLDKAAQLYITEVALDTDGDAFFPEWDRQSFTLASFQEGTRDEKNKIPHSFSLYQRDDPLS